MTKFTTVKQAIDQANDDGLYCELDGLSGFSGKKMLGFLQYMSRELDHENECYLEVGVFQGMTLLSVAKANDKLSCIGIDNFLQLDPKGENKKLIESRAVINNITNYHLFESDFEDAFDNLGEVLNGKKVGLYFVDGPHDYRSQLICLEFMKPYLSENAVIVVDDSNYRHVRQANSDFIKGNEQYTLLYENYTRCHPQNAGKESTEFNEGWWDGVNVIVRDSQGILNKMLPTTERDRTIYFNENDVQAAKYSYLTPYAMNIVKGMLDFNPVIFMKGVVKCFLKKNSRESKIHRGKYRWCNVFTEDLPRDNFNTSVK